MKALAFLAIIVVVKGAALDYPLAAVLKNGISAHFESENNVDNYNFGYNKNNTTDGSFRREVGDAHAAGSYGLRDADGRVRVVNYIADDDGFRTDIKINEPGVEPKDPADATINNADTVAVKSVAVAAPVVKPIAVVPEPAPVAVEESSSITDSAPAPVVAQPLSYAFPEAAPVAAQKSSVAVAELAVPAVHTTKTKVNTYNPHTGQEQKTDLLNSVINYQQTNSLKKLNRFKRGGRLLAPLSRYIRPYVYIYCPSYGTESNGCPTTSQVKREIIRANALTGDPIANCFDVAWSTPSVSLIEATPNNGYVYGSMYVNH